MKKSEMIRLRALVKRLHKQSDMMHRLSNRIYKNAGHSEPGGTGDEGWARTFEVGGISSGLSRASGQLRTLLDKLEKGSV